MRDFTLSQDQINEIGKITGSAIQKGLLASDPYWREMALKSLYYLALTNEELTADDMRRITDYSPEKTHDKRAMGGIIKTGVKAGWISKTGRYIPSKVGHGTPMQIWKSNLWKTI